MIPETAIISTSFSCHKLFQNQLSSFPKYYHGICCSISKYMYWLLVFKKSTTLFHDEIHLQTLGFFPKASYVDRFKTVQLDNLLLFCRYQYAVICVVSSWHIFFHLNTNKNFQPSLSRKRNLYDLFEIQTVELRFFGQNRESLSSCTLRQGFYNYDDMWNKKFSQILYFN